MVSLATMILYVFLFSLFGLLIWLLVLYSTVPIKALRSTYVYVPRGSQRNYTHTIGLESQAHVSMNQLPGHLIIALLLHEDNLFFSHRAVHWKEVYARLLAFLKGVDPIAGGSSLTQQLAKNLRSDFMWDNYYGVFLRKVRELVWSIKLEQNFSKEELLGMYMSAVRLDRGGVYGFHAAAKKLFGKNSAELSLRESFFLVGLLPQPIYIMREISEGNLEVFGYARAYEKFRDFFRMQVTLFGWRSLDRIEMMTSEEATQQMRNHHTYRPCALSPAFEVALVMHALLAVDALQEVIKDLVKRNTSDLQADKV